MENNQPISEQQQEAEAIASKYAGKAKTIALRSQRANVSRRLLLAVRSQKLTCVCPDTGIVSLLEIPAIPGFAAEYEHPLSKLSNARGIAQKGQQYLRLLDTQTLAGLLLTLASPYELFRFQPFDSGAQKNAILRTVGKDILIDAIILVETYVHNRNSQWMPKLSLTLDADIEKIGIDARFTAYLKLLSEAIFKPDTSVYDENAAPKKIGRPLYIKDIEKAERKMSFLARQEISRAKKEFEADKKEAKKLINELYKAEKIDLKGRAVLLQIFDGDALLTIENEMRAVLCMKLAAKEHSVAESLIALVKKDRKILTLDVSEVEELQNDKAEAELASTPVAMTQEEYDEEPTQGIDSEDMGTDLAEEQEASEQMQEANLVPPPGLTPFQVMLWKKKHTEKARNIVQTNLPSVAQYVPSIEKQKMGDEK